MSAEPEVICEASDTGRRIELFGDWTVRITLEGGYIEASFFTNRDELRRFFMIGHDRLGDP